MKQPRKPWLRRMITGVALTAGSLLLAACGTPAGADHTAENSTAGKRNTEASLKVAVITHQAPGDTFWDVVRTGAETAGRRNAIEVLYSADPDGAKQAQLVQQAIDQNVDGIVVSLAKADALSDVVKRAVAADIPVFSINAGEDISASLGVTAHFGQNELITGQTVGEKLNSLGAKRAICVIQEQGNIGHEARCDGLRKTFTGSAEVLYVNGQDMSNVASTITAKLQTNPDIDAVVTLGAPYAMTALDAIADAGSRAKLATVDVNSDVYQAIANGTIVFASDQQPWLQGYASVEAVRLHHDGGYVLGGGKAVLTGPSIITKENLSSVAAQFSDTETTQ